MLFADKDLLPLQEKRLGMGGPTPGRGDGEQTKVRMEELLLVFAEHQGGRSSLSLDLTSPLLTQACVPQGGPWEAEWVASDDDSDGSY